MPVGDYKVMNHRRVWRGNYSSVQNLSACTDMVKNDRTKGGGVSKVPQSTITIHTGVRAKRCTDCL